MKKRISLIITICMVVTMIPFSAYAADITPEISLEEFSEQLSDMSDEYAEEPVSNRIIVKSKRNINEFDSVDIVEGYDNLHIVQFDNSDSAEQALEYYNDSKYIEYAEEDMLISVTETENSLPASYDNHLSWGSSAIGVDDYFDYLGDTSALPEVVVGIIDTGIDLDHDFLKDRIIETGFNNSGSGKNNSEDDDDGHGTHVAGIVADNTTENVKIKAFKCMDENGNGKLSDVCLAVNAAVENDVDVINMSLGTRGSSELMEDTINNAIEQGIAVCVAAGNNGQNAKNYTPANIENCISVGAINESDQKPLWSNYGDAVDIWAPGSSIESAYNDGGYKSLSGTSMATPFVTAASALLISNNKTLNPNEVRDLIIDNSRRLEETFLDYELNALYIGVLNNFVNERTARPVFSVDEGIYLEDITVEITCDDPDAEIYYSTNGKRASQDNGILYTEPVVIDKITTLNACAYVDGKLRSLQSSATYNIVTTDPDENFEIDENGIITKYTGSNIYLSIPEKINGITVTGIGDSVFRIKPIKIIVLPDSLTFIGANAFRSAKSLTSVYANSIQTIGKYAFYKCEELTNIDLSGVEFIEEYAFFDCYKIDALSNDKLTEIKEGTFCGCDKILFVQITNVKVIERNGFNGCIGAETFILPNVECIGEGAFWQCFKITEFDLPSLKTISGSRAFSDCYKVTSFNFPLLEGDIPDYTFNGCHKIEEFKLPNVISIGNRAFDGCESLIILDLPNVINVGDNAFNSCDSLKIVYLPYVTKIGKQAFRNTNNIHILFAPSLVSTQSLPVVNPNTKIYLSDKFIEYKETFFEEQNATIIAPKNSYAETVTINGIGTYDNHFKFSPNDYRDRTNDKLDNTDDANVRAYGRSIRVTNAGLRFGFSWNEIPEIEQLASDIEYGFVYHYNYDNEPFDSDKLTVDNVGTDNIKLKKAVNLDDTDEGKTTFNLVFTNIPDDNQSTNISVRAYVCIDGMYFYSNTLNGSFSEVANHVLADEEIDESTKSMVRQLLKSEV